MEKISQKHAQLLRAIETLNIALKRFKDIDARQRPELGYDEDYRAQRDSVTQRFEYTTDLLWKYLKEYVESLDLPLEVTSPRGAVTQLCSAKILSEQEAEQILEMIRDRNLVPQSYLEEIAERLVGLIPAYYQLMYKIANKMTP